MEEVVKKVKNAVPEKKAVDHAELVAVLRPLSMAPETETGVPCLEKPILNSDSTITALEKLGKFGKKNNLRINVMKGRYLVHYLAAGGDFDDLCARLNCKKRNLDYCKAAFEFCRKYPVMLFCNQSWSQVRGMFAVLSRQIKKAKSEGEWQVPKESPNMNIKIKLLGE